MLVIAFQYNLKQVNADTKKISFEEFIGEITQPFKLKKNQKQTQTQTNNDENKENFYFSDSGEYLDVPNSDAEAKKIKDAVEFASSKTGVRKDFLMGMLVVESNLGQNTGKCTYGEVEQDAQNSKESGRLSFRAWDTFVQRRETMKEIAGSLGYDYESLKVSCNPSNYAGTGGAMGVPQFMPDIWMAYKDRISDITGKKNPDPWDVKDGVVAMALLLSDTPGVTDHNIYAERNAAKMYLSGSTSSAYNWYANQVVYWSQHYSELIG